MPKNTKKQNRITHVKRYKKRRKKSIKQKRKSFTQGGMQSIITCPGTCYQTTVLPVLFHAFTNQNEICGCAKWYNNKFQLYREQDEGEKGYCYFTDEYDILWHTHPYTSKPYPSTTDLLKVVKYNNNISFIFCIFGLWTIKFSERRDNAVINKIREKIGEKGGIEYTYYDITKRGMQPTAKALHNYIEGIKLIFNNELGVVNNVLGFDLIFNYWKNHPRLPGMPENIPDIPKDHAALSHYFTPFNPEDLFY